MLKTAFFIVSLITICFLFTSCATILSGTHQPLKISPDRDSVYVNGKIQQNKDSIVKIRRKIFKKGKVQIKRNNGETVTYSRKFNEVSLFNFIIPPFWLIDFLTGSLVKFQIQNK